MKGRARSAMWLGLVLLAAVATGLGGRSAWAAGPGECLLLVDGIPGDSADVHHRGAIDLVTWSWGVANAVSLSASGGGAGVGKPEFRPLRFVHHVDRSTPALFQVAVTGRRVASAVVVCRKAGPQLAEYLKITLSDVIVTGVQLSDPSDGPPSGEVNLVYARVAVEYRPQMPDGSLGQALPPATWDLRTGRP